MKLFWELMFMTLLIATNIYVGGSKPPNNPRQHLKTTSRTPSRTPSKTPSRTASRTAVPQKPNFKANSLRISETKCLEYIKERVEQEKAHKYNFHTFVIGGRNALQGEFPHMGALGWRTKDENWKFKCGSSLISHKFALTAAHCSKIKLDNTIVRQVPEIIRLGENEIKQVPEKGKFTNAVDANIRKIIVHPQYKSPNKYYDIALIELKSDVQFTQNVQPVCLWTKFDTSSLGTKVSSTGWGVVDIKTRQTSSILQALEINTIDSKLCDTLLRRACDKRWCGIREHQMCAGKLAGGVDACQGDSGGPLQVKMNVTSNIKANLHYLLGVTSFGKGCAQPNSPGVYTRVSSFVDWIEKIVWPKV